MINRNFFPVGSFFPYRYTLVWKLVRPAADQWYILTEEIN